MNRGLRLTGLSRKTDCARQSGTVWKLLAPFGRLLPSLCVSVCECLVFEIVLIVQIRGDRRGERGAGP